MILTFRHTNIFFFVSQSMQRRDSLGSTTKIPRLSKGSTRKFKTRRSQSSFSSASDVFAENESTKGQLDLSVSGMRLRSEKNLDGDQRRSAEAGTASETLVDPFDEGEQTLIRPDFEPSEDLEREEVERTEETSERSEVEPREEVLFKGMSKSETKSHRWRGEYSHSASTHSSLAKQSNSAMIQRGKKLGYALPLNTDFQSVENLKKFDVTKCPLHANQECIMRRVNELKSSRKLFSMKSETVDGLYSCSNFPERPTEAELAANKPVLPEIEHLKGKISDKELDSLRAELNWNADVFSKHKADIGCCNFVEHEI